MIAAFSVVGLRREAEQPKLATESSTDAPLDQTGADAATNAQPQDSNELSEPVLPQKPEPASVPKDAQAADVVLGAERPTEAQLQALLQAWLDRKASVLGGNGTADEQLHPIARAGLINQVRLQRAADQSVGRTQKVEAAVDFIRVISRTPNRIELRADVDYSDETLNAAGTVVERTAPKSLKVSYVLGRDDDGWRLQAYRPL